MVMAKMAEDKMVDEFRELNRELRRLRDRVEDNKYIWLAISKLGDDLKFGRITETGRPCYISKKSFKHGPKKAFFHRWMELKTPNMTQTLAIVEYEDGSVEQVRPTNIIFADSSCLFDEYYWLPEDDDDEEKEEQNTSSGDVTWDEGD